MNMRLVRSVPSTGLMYRDRAGDRHGGFRLSALVQGLLGWLWLGADHLLQITFMVLPDFALPISDAAVRNVAGIYSVEQETTNKLTSILSAFAESLSVLTGLPVHPPVVVPGGVSYLPDWSFFSKVSDLLNGCEHELREVLRLVEMLSKRNAQRKDTETPLDGYYLATTERQQPSLMGDGVVASPLHEGEAREMDHRSFYDSIIEEPLPWTYVVPVKVDDLTPLLVGPLARVNLGFDTVTPWAELECTRPHELWGHPLDR